MAKNPKMYESVPLVFRNLEDAPKEFEWTDETALEFAIVAQRGSWGDYYGLRAIGDKLKGFKDIKTGKWPRKSCDCCDGGC